MTRFLRAAAPFAVLAVLAVISFQGTPFASGTGVPLAPPVSGGRVASGGGGLPAVLPTNEWVNFYSQNSFLNGRALPPGAIVRAFNPRGVEAGEIKVTTMGWYGLMPVYRDDPNTSQDEGLRPGEPVAFTINGVPARTVGPDDAVWTASGVLKQVNLVASSVQPTSEWVNFYGQHTLVRGAPIPVGALVEAFDPRGFKCGDTVVNHVGWYGMLQCYRADPNVPGSPGPQPNEAISFRVDGAPATASGPDAALWSANGDTRQVDLVVAVGAPVPTPTGLLTKQLTPGLTQGTATPYPLPIGTGL